MSTTYESIIYIKLNENDAQLGGISDKDQNALNGTECPTNLTIPQYVFIESKQYTVTRVGKRSFRKCDSLTTVQFPDTISVIEEFAFDQTSIKDLILPKDLVSLGVWSFGANCIQKIVYPENLQYISNCAFSPSRGLRDFNVSKEHKYLSSDFQGALYNKDQTILYTVPEPLTEFKIPETVTKINGGAFQYSNIETIIIPRKCTSIGYFAFSSSQTKEIIILSNILNMEFQGIVSNQPLNNITYFGSIPISPNNNVLTNNSINAKIYVCVGYQSQKLSTIQITQLKTCPAVIYYTQCLNCGICTFQLFNKFKMFVSIFMIMI